MKGKNWEDLSWQQKDPDLSPDALLEYYMGQGTIERGFRFLKDKSFRVAEIFLKKNPGSLLSFVRRTKIVRRIGDTNFEWKCCYGDSNPSRRRERPT
jgi:hypothetical protein